MSTNFPIKQGSTFTKVVRWECAPYLYKPITAIAKRAPVRITSTAHGIPDGWRVAVVSVQGMTEINATGVPPRQKEYVKATVIDANTVDLNPINSSEFSTYTTGGYLQMLTPTSLTGYTARMSIKDRIGGTLIGTQLTHLDGIDIDTAAYTITITIPAATTAEYTFSKAVYSLEMVSAGGIVTELLSGTLTLSREVTT